MKQTFKGILPFIAISLILQTPVGSAYGQVSNDTGGTNTSRISEEEYVRKLFNLVSIPYGMIEIGEKMCKPAGEGYSESLVLWWAANKEIINAAKQRDALIKQRTDILQKTTDNLVEKKDTELHIEAVKLQIETFHINFDAVTGSRLFSLDQSQKLATENATIPQLEKIALKAMKAIQLNQKDHKDMVDTYMKLLDGIKVSGEVAAEACKRKKIVEECTTEKQTDTEEQTTTCTKKEIADPVPGSCEMAGLLPPYQNGPVKTYADVYLKPSMPSADLNGQMLKLEEAMKGQVAGFPKSDDPKYDWTTPLLEHEKMAKQRKKVGVICPGFKAGEDEKKTAEFTDKAAEFILPLGVGGDIAQKAAKIMNANWNETDLVIGQPGNRGEYFGYALKLINELIGIENSRIQAKVADYERLQTYLAKLNKQMRGGPEVAETCGGAAFGGSAPNPNCKTGTTSGGGSGGGAGGASGGAGGGTTGSSGGGSTTVTGPGNTAVRTGGSTLPKGTTILEGKLADFPENEILKRNIAASSSNNIGSRSNNSVSELQSIVPFGGDSSGFTVGPLSSSSMAVAKSLASDVNSTSSTLVKSANSASGKNSGLATVTNSTVKSGGRYSQAIEETNQKLGTLEDYKEIAKALGGNSRSASVADSAAERERQYRTTTRDLGYSSGAKGAWTPGSTSSSSSTSTKMKTSETDEIVASKLPASESLPSASSSGGAWKKRAAPIELFDNISDAYRKVGRQKLGVDEIRGE